MWVLNEDARPNNLPHSPHLRAFIPLCQFVWSEKAPNVRNPLPQIVQMYFGSGFLCLCLWWCRPPEVAKPFPQISQKWVSFTGSDPWILAIWRFSITFDVRTCLQMLQGCDSFAALFIRPCFFMWATTAPLVIYCFLHRSHSYWIEDLESVGSISVMLGVPFVFWWVIRCLAKFVAWMKSFPQTSHGVVCLTLILWYRFTWVASVFCVAEYSLQTRHWNWRVCMSAGDVLESNHFLWRFTRCL